jgi:hypothetical protein
MTTQGWTPTQALAEMDAYGFRRFWFHHLKEYVRRFPERHPQARPSPGKRVTLAPVAANSI